MKEYGVVGSIGLTQVNWMKNPVQPFAGTGHLPNRYRRSAGPGWALVGDAGHFKDPSTGMGMSDAFMAADLLAEALDLGLTGRVDGRVAGDLRTTSR